MSKQELACTFVLRNIMIMNGISSMFFEQYRSYPVNAALSKHIDCIWTEGFSKLPEYHYIDHLIVPDNTAELIFSTHSIERRFANEGDTVMKCHSHLAGLKTKPQLVKLKGAVLIAVRFKPYGLYRFTNIPLHETIDRSVPTEYLFGSAIKQLEEELLLTNDLKTQVVLINSFFTKKLVRSKQSADDMFDHVCGQMISSGGMLKINELADQLRVSVKTVERRFNERLGLSPKKYAQILRFFQSMKTAFDPERDCLGSLAYANGYYDQMHFVKEVKRFTGLTPREYFSLDRGIQAPIFSEPNTSTVFSDYQSFLST